MQVTKWAGKPITTPGIYADVPIEFYHSARVCREVAVSSSVLRTILARSPAHAWATSVYNRNRIDESDKAAYVLGRAAHHLILGEANFKQVFAVRPERYDSWKTNEAQSWRAEMQRIGRTVLIPEQLRAISGMALALVRHPIVKAGVLNGEIERSMFVKNDETRMWIKARPDAVPSDWQSFADLKTTVDADYDSLRQTVFKFRYDVQAAIIRMLARTLLGRVVDEFHFVFVTKSPPYLVEVVSLDGNDLFEAEKDVLLAARVFARCYASDDWFGPNGTQNDLRNISFSEWQRKDLTFRREFLEQELRVNQGETG